MGRCSLKRSHALHVTSFPSKVMNNMDGCYDLPTLNRLRGGGERGSDLDILLFKPWLVCCFVLCYTLICAEIGCCESLPIGFFFFFFSI
jgi:hypothetical protein